MSKGLRWASALVVIAALAAPAEAKTFRWANDGDANSMDPYARQETFLLLFDMSMYEPLVRRNREMKLEPGLATEWSNVDPTIWRFKLRQGVKFHDGSPFTADDVLASRMVADPFHLLDCAMTSEGGAALLITTRARARDISVSSTSTTPIYVLGAGVDRMGPAYQHPPSWDLRLADDDLPNGWVGRRAARRAFASAGLTPDAVDVAELYDPFSFEIIRQLEAFGFCEPGEGGAFVMSGGIGPDGRLPVTTDGGLMSFSHGGRGVQQLQRVVRAVQQLCGTSSGNQVPGASVALCSNGGAGAMFSEVLLLGRERA